MVLEPLEAGQQVGCWTLGEMVGKPARQRFWSCRCACGTVRRVAESALQNAKSRSCGCRGLVVPGQVVGKLTALELVPSRHHGARQWHCRCACGNEVIYTVTYLLQKRACSCVNHKRGVKEPSHGYRSKMPEYSSYRAMINRCERPATVGYERYGGAGVKVCSSWRQDFVAFYKDMGPRPSSDHSLDRYPDRRGNYEPGNCRWATRREQNNNTSANVYITVNGETHTLAEWCRIKNLNHRTIQHRIRRGGWDPIRALTEPVNKNFRPRHLGV